MKIKKIAAVLIAAMMVTGILGTGAVFAEEVQEEPTRVGENVFVHEEEMINLYGEGATYDYSPTGNVSPVRADATFAFINENITYLGNYLFTPVADLQNILIGKSVTAISDTAFVNAQGNLPAHLQIQGYADSYAQTYAQEHGIDFVEIVRVENEDGTHTFVPASMLDEEGNIVETQNPPALPEASGATELVKGMECLEVFFLQSGLQDAGYTITDAQGYFGDSTYEAVVAFQQDHGLYVDGVAGPVTNQAVNELSYQKWARESLPANAVYGSSADEVMILQSTLSSLGYEVGEIDGYFGDMTKNALSQFQKDHGLADNGILDAQTVDALLNAPAPENTEEVSEPAPAEEPEPAPAPSAESGDLVYGMTGDGVLALQSALAAAGFNPGPLDGYFGDMTYNAVLQFQTDKGLLVDGIVGPYTMAALNGSAVSEAAPEEAPAAAPEEPAPEAPAAPQAAADLVYGMTGDGVLALQNALAAAGFNPGPLDGYFGDMTYNAVLLYQEASGLYVDGIVGPYTGSALGLF
ncbi:MAG: peptidoglycan-binding protein [Parasporobacterium sp.]|nr:peptidoglycan-binding protein [Parasporobacterium sp.]